MQTERERARITGYLASATYCMPTFRAMLRKEVVESWLKDVPSDEEVDLNVVIQHLRRAENRVLIRNVLLLVIALIAFFGVLPQLDSYGGQDEAIGQLLLLYIVAVFIMMFEGMSAENAGLSALDGSLPDDSEGQFSQKRDNLIVYGGYLPFVGSGVLVGAWSFALNVNRSADEITGKKPPEEFSVQDVYSAIEKDLAQLRIPGLSVYDRLYADGREISDNSVLLPEKFAKPVDTVQEEVLNTFIDQPSQFVRHYKIFRIVHWGGDTAFTICFRCWKSEKMLFVEANSFVLPPLQRQFYTIDVLKGLSGLTRFRRLFAKMLFLAPFQTVLAPFLLAQLASRPIRHWFERRRIRKSIRRGERFNYGATQSIRDSVIDDDYHVFFQRLDQIMYTKILEKELLDTLINFLESKGVDISDVKERSMTVLNNGVIVSGGTLKAQTLAVGKDARAKTSVASKTGT